METRRSIIPTIFSWLVAPFFPRAAGRNPTLTIVATSIRLADHLKKKFQADGAL